LKLKVSPLYAAIMFACTAASAVALGQTDDQVPESALARQIHRMDLGITGVGMYNTTVKGPNSSPVANQPGVGTITQFGSNTAALLGELRYIVKPYVGFEFNYGYGRYTENYSVSPFQIQTRVNEYTLGYIATPPVQFLGIQPYLGAGGGAQGFTPTKGGGVGAKEQARATYYYTIGVQKDLDDAHHFGLRVGFRELFFLDPDFGQNYLTITKHANTYEPQAGFYLRY
jgi:hypothetical protein